MMLRTTTRASTLRTMTAPTMTRVDWCEVEWKFVSEEDMEQYAMNTGTMKMPRSSALNLDSHVMVLEQAF